MNDYPDFNLEPKNISEAIPGVVDWLRGTPGYKDSFVYTTVMNAVKNDEERGKSYALRLLIHYLGDVHQPLHCLSRVDDNYPAGDRGGNDFPLPNHYSANELHAVWDSVIYEFHVNDKLPYDATTWEKLTTSVTKLSSRFTIAPSEYATYDVQAWAKETSKTGADSAYKGATEGEALSQAYISKNNEIAARQLVLASKRLVKVITMIFGTSESVEETPAVPEALAFLN
jgi:hypothetical protein